MIKAILLILITIVVVLAVYGYTFYTKFSNNPYELVYSNGNIIIKKLSGEKPIETILIPEGKLPANYEFQSTHKMPISPDWKRFAFAMSMGDYGGVGGGELYVTNKVFIVDLSGSLKEILYQDPYVNKNPTEAHKDYWEVERWIDNDRLLIDRQSGYYVNLSNGKIILNVNGVVESIIENENFENDLRRLKE